MKEITPKNRSEWRKWLEKNHSKEKEINVIYYKPASQIKGISYDESVEEALCFGWIDGIIKRIDDEKYTRRFTPRKPKSIWSLINVNRVAKMIEEGKITEAGLKVIEVSKKNGSWHQPYSLREKKEIPGDLKIALHKNKIAWENFNKFSNSSQSGYINHIKKIKGVELRKERIKMIVDLAEKNIKPYINQKFVLTNK